MNNRAKKKKKKKKKKYNFKIKIILKGDPMMKYTHKEPEYLKVAK